MRKVAGTLDGLSIIVNITESLNEFKQGLRLFASVHENEGILYNFTESKLLRFANSGVDKEIALLFFDNFVGQVAVVTEVKFMQAGSNEIVVSSSNHTMALEIDREFYNNNKIGVGSILGI